MLKSTILTRLDEFARLETAWNALAAQLPIDHVYFKHQWFACWARAFGLDGRLAVVTLEQDGQLVAAAPLYRRPMSLKGLRVRGVSFLCGGITPRCNLLVKDPSYVEPLLRSVLQLPGWDLLELENLETETAVTGETIRLLEQRVVRFPYDLQASPPAPYRLTSDSWDDYWNSLPSKRRHQLKLTTWDRLAKAESFEVVEVTTPQHFETWHQAMFDISAKSWKANIGTNLKPDSELGRFYLDFTPRALAEGWVYLLFLVVNGAPVGCFYLLRNNTRYAGVRTDYDESAKYYSPGNALRLHMLKHLHDRAEACEYDTGVGAAEHKLDWCDRLRPQCTLTIANRHLKGRLIMFAKNRLLPAWRRLRNIPDDPNQGASRNYERKSLRSRGAPV